MEADRRPPELKAPRAAASHGDQRRAWSDAFLAYAYALVAQAAYKRMPCTVDANGKLDWIIPSNRKPGSKNWDGNARRREWWAGKAREIGIPTSGHWISQTAKRIHPWGWKPCQTCGRWMRISYAYPTVRTIEVLNAHLPESERLRHGDLLDVFEVAEHLVDTIGGHGAAAALQQVFPELGDVPGLDLPHLLEALDPVVQAEPRGRLSPGAMSNAPDRLDGFHTYNLCCRSKEDTGRFSDNLRTYGVDRRAFEHWSEGDWEAANQLMNRTSEGTCPRCGKRRALTADHIGPISLGFRHTPYFEAVCGPCNSAKNNRMRLADVQHLLALEASGTAVASWQALPLWNSAKNLVTDDAGALRLSKLMNVNQHEFLRLLLRARAAEIPDALMQFLSPEYAAERVDFVGLDPATLRYEGIERKPRQASYAEVKASRLIRVAFDTLDEYARKPKRNVPALPTHLVTEVGKEVGSAIEAAAADSSTWRRPLLSALDRAAPQEIREAQLRDLLAGGSYAPDHDYSRLKEAFEGYMGHVGEILAGRFDDDQAIKIWDGTT